jgi:hypothetical protein
MEAPEGKEVIVVVKLVESEDVEDEGDPPIGTIGRPDVEDEGDPPPTGRPDVWFGDSVGGNVAIEVPFEDWASNEDPVLGAEDGGATTPPDKVLDNKDPVLDAVDWDEMIDEGFNSVVEWDEIKLTESTEGNCNTGGLDVELELIPLERNCKTGALEPELDPRLMPVLLEGDCEIEGPDGEPDPRLIVLLEVDCKTGGVWGFNVWPGSALAVLLKDDGETAGDWGIVWLASVLTLLVRGDDVAGAEVLVEVVILVKDVDVEDGDSETQRTWPIERPQFEYSVGLKA